MKRTVVDCDRCGKECEDHISIVIPNGTHSYSDGIEWNKDFLYENKDLCNKCAEALLKHLFSFKKQTDGSWASSRFSHPGASTNDAVALALRFFKIKEKP
jgi:hypothetical protein